MSENNDEDESHRRPRDGVALRIVLIVGGTALFVLYMLNEVLWSVPRSAPSPPPVSGSAPGNASLKRRNEADAMLKAFATALAEKRFPNGHALMAAAYRERHDAAAFQKTCAQSPLLSGATDIIILNTREQYAAGGSGNVPDSFVARGILRSTAGNMEVSVHMTIESGHPRILSLVAGGIPLLQGLTQ